MKINYLNILLVAWSIITLLLYISLFSSFGYFETREKTFYKNNLIYENEYLQKENKLLEEKILKLEMEKTQIEKHNNNIYIFKFEQTIPDEIIEKQKKEKRIYNIYKEKKLYFYLYIFLVIVGYIYIIFFNFKVRKNNP